MIALRTSSLNLPPYAGWDENGVWPQMAATATPAVHALRKHGLAFTEHEYRYEDRGGTAVSSRELGVPEHQVVKTLVMEDERSGR